MSKFHSILIKYHLNLIFFIFNYQSLNFYFSTIFHYENLCFGCKRLFQNISNIDMKNADSINASGIKMPIFYKN